MAGSGRQIEAVTADQAEVVGQDVTVERLAELRANRTTTDASGKTAENGTGYRAQGYTDRAGNNAERCAGLAASQSSANATCDATDRADSSAGLHGVMERSDFGGVTARALQ
ncbi:TPA: hypothetical protein NH806_005440 [Pseudomonas aeruginosa]|nr:hypothetical protein [Pseudomonas aeruginosa]HCF0229281.1 hypothetical protein [Pseudomonas aeruginosa]